MLSIRLAADLWYAEFWHAARGLRRRWLLTWAICLALGLGVGANGAVLVQVDRELFRQPSAVLRPHELVRVQSSTNYLGYLGLVRGRYPLEVAGYTSNRVSLGLGRHARAIRVECVTDSYFSVLGTSPWQGAGLVTPAGGPSRGEPQVVIAHSLWEQEFSGDASVLGTPFRLGDRVFAVVGVMPPGFTGVELAPVDAWISLSAYPEACSFTGRNLLSESSGAWLRTIARRPAGWTLEQSEARVAAWHDNAGLTKSKGTGPPRVKSSLAPLYESRLAHLSRHAHVAIWVAAASLSALAIACLNVVSLLMVQSIDRRHEMALRRQLGATRLRLARATLTESVLLGALSAVVAGSAAIGVGPFVAGLFEHGGTSPGGFYAVVAGIAFMVTVLGGQLAAWLASRGDPALLLNAGTRTVPAESGLRNLLLSAQVALAFILLAATGMFARSVANAVRDPGYAIDDVIVVSLDLRRFGVHEDQEILDRFAELERSMRRLPGTIAAASSSGQILGSGTSSVMGSIRTLDTGAQEMALIQAVSDSFWEATGTRLTRGRGFSAAEEARLVVVVDEQLAGRLWPNAEPIGQCAEVRSLEANCAEVVGVSRRRRQASLTSALPEFFVPLAQAAGNGIGFIPRTLFVRMMSSVKTRDAVARVSAAVHGQDRQLPFAEVRPLADLVDIETRTWRLGRAVFGVFGALTLSLVGIGLYAALALAMKQRTQDIGVCLALGASGWQLVRLTFRQGMISLLFGAGLGGVGAIACSHLLRRLLYGVPVVDLATLAYALVAIAAAILLGSAIPVLRAARFDPASLLREP